MIARLDNSGSAVEENGFLKSLISTINISPWRALKTRLGVNPQKNWLFGRSSGPPELGCVVELVESFVSTKGVESLDDFRYKIPTGRLANGRPACFPSLGLRKSYHG